MSPTSPFQWFPELRTAIIAVISAACGIAGSIATGLPGGELQRGAAAIADTCEASGFRAYPPDAGGIFVPVPPSPGLEQPAPAPLPGPELGHLVPALPSSLVTHQLAAPRLSLQRGLLWPPSPAWRGEWRGWAA